MSNKVKKPEQEPEKDSEETNNCPTFTCEICIEPALIVNREVPPQE